MEQPAAIVKLEVASISKKESKSWISRIKNRKVIQSPLKHVDVRTLPDLHASVIQLIKEKEDDTEPFFIDSLSLSPPLEDSDL